MNKGDTLYIQGKLHTKASIDCEGIRRYKTCVIANSFEFFSLNFANVVVEQNAAEHRSV